MILTPIVVRETNKIKYDMKKIRPTSVSKVHLSKEGQINEKMTQ